MGLLPTNKDQRVFVSWVRHTTRSVSLAEALNAECHFFHKAQDWGYSRHLAHGFQTVLLLLRRRPGFVFCMNPPYFVGLVAYLYGLFFNARFALDSHTAAFGKKWMQLKGLHAFLAKRAVVSTVTNEELAARVQEMGGRSIIVTDIPHTMPNGSYRVEQDRFTVCFVGGYAADEPVLEVLDAARRLPDVQFYFTGDTKNATEKMQRTRPENVTFTGWLANEEYAGLINGVSAIMVLTTRDFTMQRGGSEAISAGKPLITSDWPLLRQVFSKGTVHVNNTTDSIVKGVEIIQKDFDRYRREIGDLAVEREERWRIVHAELEGLISEA